MAKRLNQDQDLISEIWNDFTFEILLEQSLIIELEDVARWAIKNNLTTGTKVPNYLNYIYLDALAEVKPEAIFIY